MLVTLVVILLLFVAVQRKSAIGYFMDYAYESMFDFFADILWSDEALWIKTAITNLFFVIFFYNVLGLLVDFFAPVFGYVASDMPWLSQYVLFGTSDYHFTLAVAAIWVVLTLWIQLFVMKDTRLIGWNLSRYLAANTHRDDDDTSRLGGYALGSMFARWLVKLINFVYEYLPFLWKGIIAMDRGNMRSGWIYYPLWALVKLFDIAISLFVGFLDIVGVFAKVISLAFRLFGNMMAGTALLTVMIVWLNETTLAWIGLELPLLAPVLLFAQWLLVACIQAFVFPLLIAIFAKVARMSWEDTMDATDATA